MIDVTIPKMITFTNQIGEVNRGIVIGTGKETVEVLWETFSELTDRLRNEKKLKDTDRVNLSVRVSWVKPGRSVLSPLADGPDRWETAEHKQLYRAALDGTFDQALEELRPAIYRKHY